MIETPTTSVDGRWGAALGCRPAFDGGAETLTSVMISYSHEDAGPAQEVAMYFAAEGVDVWFDDWEIGLGDSIPGEREEGLSGATHVILMWSKNAAESNWVSEERRSALTRAVHEGAPQVIVVRLDDHPLPPLLENRKYRRWNGGSEADREKLVRGVLDRAPDQNYIRDIVRNYISAVVQQAQELTINGDETDDPLPYEACPSCGGSRLERSSANYAGDGASYAIECAECGWGASSQ